MNNPAEKLKTIIERFTLQKRSVLIEKILLEAGEQGIGESIVEEGLQQLIKENFIYIPFKGVVKRQILEYSKQL